MAILNFQRKNVLGEVKVLTQNFCFIALYILVDIKASLVKFHMFNIYNISVIISNWDLHSLMHILHINILPFKL